MAAAIYSSSSNPLKDNKAIIFGHFRGFLLDFAGPRAHLPRPVHYWNPPYHHMRGVNLKKGEPVDRALKRLKSKLDSEGILEEMRRRRAFETPTERKQRKLRSASKRNKIRWRYNSGASAEISED